MLRLQIFFKYLRSDRTLLVNDGLGIGISGLHFVYLFGTSAVGYVLVLLPYTLEPR